MILKHLKTLAETQSKSEIQDVVLTVPVDWDMNRRQMLVDSAEMAGLRITSLITENVGSVIAYAIDR